MSEPFLGEIKIVSFNFPPDSWAFCNGQLLPINQNQALFSLMGTTYGGNGQMTFALPDLRGRASIHRGDGFLQGQAAGSTTVALTTAEIPAHAHLLQGSSLDGDGPVATSNVLAGSGATPIYGPATGLTTLHPSSVSSVGAGQPHENMQPSLVLTFCIALQGIFPSQSF